MNEKRRRANALMMKYYSGMVDEGRWRHASGDIAVFNTKYRRNLKSLVVQLEPVQAGSGDPSPDNVRPISGWTGATVYRSGKNLLNPAGVTIRAASQGLNIEWNLSGYVRLYGTYTGPDRVTEQLKILNVDPDLTSFNIKGFSDSLNFALLRWQEEASQIVVRLQNLVNNTNYNIIVYPMVYAGTEPTTYEPYTGTTIPVSSETEAGTVYGAELDVVSGVLTVTHKMVDGGSLNWAYWTNDSFYVTANDKYSRAVKDVICSCYPSIVGNVSATFGIYVSLSSDNTRNNIYLADTQYSHDAAGAAQLKADMTGQQIVYPLATPQTYQLTPQQIQTLTGENVIWSDAGPVSVEYWS